MWAAHARIIIQLAAVTLAFYSRMLRSNLILMIVAPSNVFAIGPAEAIAGLVRIVTGLAIAFARVSIRNGRPGLGRSASASWRCTSLRR